MWALKHNGDEGGGFNGVYTDGGTNFPTGNGNGQNYWVDVVFREVLPPDTTPPIVTVSPTNGASGVSVGTDVRVTFSEAMDITTVTNAGTITLTNTTAGVGVAATVAYYASTNTAVLTPTDLLSPLTNYTVRVKGGTGGVADTSTNYLTNDFTSSFTTEPPDETLPTVFSVNPTNTASGVSPGTTVSVTFSEAMKASTITTGTITLKRFPAISAGAATNL